MHALTEKAKYDPEDFFAQIRTSVRVRATVRVHPPLDDAPDSAWS
jgi:hypothetical protein